jgi:hypothetical protein
MVVYVLLDPFSWWSVGAAQKVLPNMPSETDCEEDIAGAVSVAVEYACLRNLSRTDFSGRLRM